VNRKQRILDDIFRRGLFADLATNDGPDFGLNRREEISVGRSISRLGSLHPRRQSLVGFVQRVFISILVFRQTRLRRTLIDQSDATVAASRS
jgi:hypothetical protein